MKSFTSKFTAFLFGVCLAASIAAAPIPTNYRPNRYSSSPIIPLAPGTFYAGFTGDYSVFVNPADSTQLLMYLTAAETQPSYNNTVGLMTASVSNPYSWTPYGNVLVASDVWESGGIRLGCVFYDSGTYYMYYTSLGNVGVEQSIGLATSTDGTTWTKHASNPILTPTGQGRNDGTHVSEAAVIKEGSSWTMLYSYRGAAILPGFRAATSSDGVTWTKVGSGDVLTTDPLYGEFHQVLKVDGIYYLLYEAGSSAKSYCLYMASSSAVTGPYTNFATNPIYEGSRVVGTFDRYHVATPSMTLINGQWHIFYQGGGTTDIPNYIDNTWPTGVAIFPLRSSAATRGKGR